MSKKIDNRGVHIESSSFSGDNFEIAGRDIIHTKSIGNTTTKDFEELLFEIKSNLEAIPLDPTERQGVETNLDIAQKQAKQKKPNGGLIVSSLTTAMSLIKSAGGAAKAVESVVPLFQKAITYAKDIF